MWRRTSRDRAVFVGLVLATVSLLTLDFRTGVVDGMSSGFGEVLGVFQTGVRTASRPFESFVGSVRELGALRAENEELGRENQVLRRQAETYTDLARENARLRELNTLEGSFDLETIRSRVIGASLSGLERSALLDKGRSSSIAVDKPVLTPEGLAGRIVWAGRQTSKALLLTDSQSAIGVKVGETGETGVVTGTGGRLLRLELVSRAALDQGAVKRGDVVLTSGYQGGVFPPGIPIGRVEEVDLAHRGTTYTILVRPFARLSRLDIVSVVVGQGEVVEAAPSPSPGARPSPMPEGDDV